MNIDKIIETFDESIEVDQEEKSTFGLIFHWPESLKEIKSKIRASLSRKTVIERQKDVVPFLELNIKNAPSVYAITKSYIEDIKQKNKKNFGFTSANTNVSDLILLGIGSCISYSLDNMPVLLVVNNTMSPDWDKYRKNFTPGTIGRWKTYDWGNICLLDYNEILSTSLESPQIDLKIINEEFGSVLWSLPPIEQSENLKQFYISVFKSLDSVAMVIPELPAKFSEVEKIQKFYSSIGVPLKGILNGGKKK